MNKLQQLSFVQDRQSVSGTGLRHLRSRHHRVNSMLPTMRLPTTRPRHSVPTPIGLSTGVATGLSMGMSTGFAELDQALGGWAQAALTEIISEQLGAAEWRLLLPALAGLSQGKRWLAWVAPSQKPHAQFYEQAGVDLSHVLLVEPAVGRAPTLEEQLKTTEQVLSGGNCAAVITWFDAELSQHQMRRLQVAAQQGGSWGIIIHAETPKSESEDGSVDAIWCSAQRVKMLANDSGVTIQVLKRYGAVQQLTQQMELGLCDF